MCQIDTKWERNLVLEKLLQRLTDLQNLWLQLIALKVISFEKMFAITVGVWCIIEACFSIVVSGKELKIKKKYNGKRHAVVLDRTTKI